MIRAAIASKARDITAVLSTMQRSINASISASQPYIDILLGDESGELICEESGNYIAVGRELDPSAGGITATIRG